jgi:hypothetical protein
MLWASDVQNEAAENMVALARCQTRAQQFRAAERKHACDGAEEAGGGPRQQHTGLARQEPREERPWEGKLSPDAAVPNVSQPFPYLSHQLPIPGL